MTDILAGLAILGMIFLMGFLLSKKGTVHDRPAPITKRPDKREIL